MSTQTTLEVKELSRRINSEFYLRDISFEIKAGQVHALVGKNASGKSSLISVLVGRNPKEGGEILLDGKPVDIARPEDSKTLGILMMGQNMGTFDNMDIAQNIYLGQEPYMSAKLKLIDTKAVYQNTARILKEMDVDLSPKQSFGGLSAGQKQLVAIARAMVSKPRVVILDEPSTHLSASERAALHRAIASLKKSGVAFLLVSHDLDEVLEAADVVSVMDHGELTATFPAENLSKAALVEAMFGFTPNDLYHKEAVTPGDVALSLNDVGCHSLGGTSFSMRAGEIAGILGDVHSGKVELARILGGFQDYTGDIEVAGKPVFIGHALDALQAGISYAGSREEENTIENYRSKAGTAANNTGLRRMVTSIMVTGTEVGKALGSVFGYRNREEYMTGGNEQRELVERAMRRPASVYVLFDPMAGVDIPSKMRFYLQINKLAASGAAILLFTSDPDEALGLSDHILVLSKGKITKNIPISEIDEISKSKMINFYQNLVD